MSLRLKAMFTAIVLVWMGAAPPAWAWGDVGHKVTGLIAYDLLTPKARAAVDALLASDTDSLTAPDFASRATWADKYRTVHPATAQWHFADIEIDHPDMAKACFGFPLLASGQLASQGPAKDCVIDKVTEFEAELHSAATPAAERLTALKFLIHFIGDLHQPLHASDHNDSGGNCTALAASLDFSSKNLHAYWDTGAVIALGGSPADIAARLGANITTAKARAWVRGDAKVWAQESFALAKSVAYNLAVLPGCQDHTPITLDPAYEMATQKVVAEQLEKAAVRIAAALNRALG